MIGNKQIIIDKFIEYTRHKSIDKITITDLSNRCGLSRQTIYKYFYDVDDIINQIIALDFNLSLDIIMNSSSQDNLNSDSLYSTLNNIILHKDFYMNLFRSIESYWSKNYIFAYLYNYLYSLLSNISYPNEIDYPLQLELVYFCNGLQSLLYRWIIDNFKTDIDSIFNIIKEIVPPRLYQFIHDYQSYINK